MTTGNFTSLSVDSIVVNNSDRQRKTLTGIDELADSIAQVGLINPILVDKETLELVAGERRLTACKQLGWTHINVQFAQDMPQSMLYLIELEENVKRVELPWRDECAAIARYHELKLAQAEELGEEWSKAKTAEALGLGAKEARYRISIHEAIQDGDKLICEADKYTVARNIIIRKKERAAQYDTSRLDELLSTPRLTKEAIARDDNQEKHTTYMDEVADDYSPSASPDTQDDFPYVVNASMSEYLQKYDGPKFNFLHCDFPYGINANSHKQGAAGKFGGYADGEDVYTGLLSSLASIMDTHVSDSAHMIFWYSMKYHNSTVSILESMGWTVNPFPLIWFRSDNSGILPDPSRGGRRTYETALHCTRGDRKIVQPVSMLYPSPNTKNIHMSEKPLPVLQHFFRMFVDETTVMLDPTAGSGNAVAQSILSGGKLALGIELDPEFAKLANENVNKLLDEL